jgi:integrase
MLNPARRAEAPAPGKSNAGQVLDQDQLTILLAGFRGLALYPIVVTAALTGARRGEILALRWTDFDAAAKTLRIERAVEDSRLNGRTVKEPKTERGVRTITIDDTLVTLLMNLRDDHARLIAGVGANAPVDLSLVKLPDDALIFPSPTAPFSLTKLRAPKTVTKDFAERAHKLDFPKLRFHDLRGTHETLLLDAGVPVHVVAERCGHDPAVLLRSYAKRTKKADTSAAAIIGALSRSMLAQ